MNNSRKEYRLALDEEGRIIQLIKAAKNEKWPKNVQLMNESPVIQIQRENGHTVYVHLESVIDAIATWPGYLDDVLHYMYMIVERGVNNEDVPHAAISDCLKVINSLRVIDGGMHDGTVA